MGKRSLYGIRKINNGTFVSSGIRRYKRLGSDSGFSVLKATPVLGVSNAKIATVGLKCIRQFSLLSPDALILGVVDV